IAAVPAWGLPHYLLGRQLYNRGGHPEAAQEMERALALGLLDPRFTIQAMRIAGQAWLRSGDRPRARAGFERLLPLAAQEGEGARLDVLDWIERAQMAGGASP